MRRKEPERSRRPHFKKTPNPFAELRESEHQKAVKAGVIHIAAEIGGRRFSKATYSRTLAGRLQLADPEVIRHLRTAISTLDLAALAS
jgi:hypothetical protein